MHNCNVKRELDWRSWDIFDWNRRFFEDFFHAGEGDTAPVSRIVVNRGVLKRVAQSPNLLGNTRAVFERNYLDSGRIVAPMPPPLGGHDGGNDIPANRLVVLTPFWRQQKRARFDRTISLCSVPSLRVAKCR